MIESGSRTAANIKSHHNVGGLPEEMELELVEPLRDLFKDEVRQVGAELGLPEEIVQRQPFPGPGLAVRIVGEVTAENLDEGPQAPIASCGRRSAAPVSNARRGRRSACCSPDVQSVGVMGDGRTYENPVVVRAVTCEDAMTADWARLPVRRARPDRVAGSSARYPASTGWRTTSRRSRPARSSGSDRSHGGALEAPLGAAPVAWGHDDRGQVLADRYAVGELLGRGGMAEVYLATDRVLDRPVAVKVLGGWLANDGTFVERFRREALAAARISHPNLVAVFDAGSEDGVHYIVMEHVPGETLADVLRQGGPPPPQPSDQIAASVADALAVAHAAGIVHRDVKPANVMLTPDGRTKLMDLGIASEIDGESITQASSILGRPATSRPNKLGVIRWTIARTSTRSGASSTRCSRAANRSRLRIRSPWPTSMCTRPRSPRRRSSRRSRPR